MKISITDLIDNQTVTEKDFVIQPDEHLKTKTRNEIEDFISFKDNNDLEKISKRENKIYELTPKTNLEKKLDSILNKRSLAEIKERKNFQHQFSAKMQRARRIKSKTFRRFRREAKKAEEEQVVSKKINIPQPLIAEENETMEEVEVEGAPIFEFSGKIEDTQNNEVVRLAFEEEMNENTKDFVEEKEKIINEEAPVVSETILPGWGGWAGPGLKITKNKHNVLINRKDGIKNSERRDFKAGHVIINETKEKLDDKFKSRIPFGYSREEYIEKLNMPISKECNTNRIFSKILKSKIKTQKGKPVEPEKFNLEN
ncbi:U3 small nucleolar RNA-associated protein 14 [Nosema granulosis]|uniref:U3 small nucleolar RNA-associated protein 14 n=1 Tax=Nosema granulosis TaxID=83296 RepID=A0A9P6H1E5_9MICR|nr:U3 small nucleolar RNA-associated protein 14 [Nosema granulosis]